jgi:DNA-binding response OmpR family regulator
MGSRTDFKGILNAMINILLVEDEYLIRYSLSATLRYDGSKVTAVSNGKDALGEMRRLSYDICFLDVNLPDSNGLDLMNVFREISQATKIIIMTAADLNERQLSDLHKNACHLLPKPFDLEDVRSLVYNISRPEAVAPHEAIVPSS